MKHTGQEQTPYRYLMTGLRTSPDLEDGEILQLANDRMKRKGISTRTLHFRLYKRSVDARRRDDVRMVYTVLIESEDALPEHLLRAAELRETVWKTPSVVPGKESLSAPPLVVGMGPAGLFAALLLAENGYHPVLIDRGGSIDDRVAAVENFRDHGVLDPECNVQFGAGGAGTFSDGKLVTRIHDPYCRYLLETFHRFGAPDEILTLAKPHIGTDLLRQVVSAMLAEIERLGGKVIYRCRLDGFREAANHTLIAKTTRGEIPCGAMILALGHSARDTYRMLLEKQFPIEPKPISVGVRAEHLQSEIDRALYGRFAGHPRLKHAEYALSDTTGERGVYTFCMCPGGEVIAASSEENGLVVNGMSRHARDGKNANAAVLVSVGCADYPVQNGSHVLGAIAFQRAIEQAAFRAGGSDYCAPVMTLGDFLAGTTGTEPTRVQPSYRNGKVRLADFKTVFPGEFHKHLQRAFLSFGKKVEGYDAADTVLTAAETRTSSPLRILRSSETLQVIGHDRIYPCGEGAGYAGGITSAGVDGLRCAEQLIARFRGGNDENNGNGD